MSSSTELASETFQRMDPVIGRVIESSTDDALKYVVADKFFDRIDTDGTGSIKPKEL